MEYNRSKLPNWKHCQRCGRLYKGLWELLCPDCRAGRYDAQKAPFDEPQHDTDDTHGMPSKSKDFR
jgi:hypothetical protein